MIANKKHGYSDGSAFGDVERYIRRAPEIMRDDMQPVLALGCERVASPEMFGFESKLRYDLSKAHKPTLTHWVVSWAPKEVVSAQEAQDAFDRLTVALGYHEQTALWALQADGAEKIYHIHVAYGGIDESLKADWHRRNDYATVRDMLRQMELDYGRKSGAKGAKEAVQRAEEIVLGARIDISSNQILDRLTQYQSHFSRQHVMTAIQKAGVTNRKQAEDLRKMIFLKAKQIGPDAWTTDDVWRAEERVTKALAGLGKGFVGIEGGKPSKGLDEQQVRAFNYALETGSRRKLITGCAGSGKSRSVRDIARVFEKAGYDVRAVSMTHAACGALTKQTGIPCRTVASELFRWGTWPESKLTSNDVLIIDEVSQLGTTHAAELLEAADRAGAIVLGFGDHKQFGSVGHGNVLGEWMRLGDGIDLEKTRRQNIEWMRQATEDMRAGRVREALDAYRDANMIHRHRTQRGARAKLVSRWKDYESEGYTVSVSTYSNRERIKLAQQVREAHRQLGRLTSSDVWMHVQDGYLPFAVGDRVTIRGNLPELGLRNGMAATVVGIYGTTMQVERDGRVVDIDTTASPDHRAVEHGYVSTTYREMGETRQVSMAMLTRYENAASINVSFSRHTDAFEAFFSHEHCGTYEHVVEMASHDRLKYSAHEVAEIETQKAERKRQFEIDERERKHRQEVVRAAEDALKSKMSEKPQKPSVSMEERYDFDTLDKHRRNVALAEKMIVPLAGTAGEEYLQKRGLAKPGHIIPSNVYFAENWAQGFETNSRDMNGRPKVSPGYGPAVVFPLYDFRQKVVGYQGRFVTPPVFSGRSVKVWTVGPSKEAVYASPGAWDAPCVSIHEGGTDALAMVAMGVEVFAAMGTGNVPDWLPDELVNKEVLLSSDPDGAGKKMADSLAASLAARSSTTRIEFPKIDVPEGEKMDVAWAFAHAPEAMKAEVILAQRRVFDPLQRAWVKLHEGRPCGKARDVQLYRELGTLGAKDTEMLGQAEAQARRDVGLPPLETAPKQSRGRSR